MDAQPVPEQAQQKSGQKYQPKPYEALREVSRPTPLRAANGVDHAPADQVSTQSKEDDDCLVSEIRDSVRGQHKGPGLCYLREIHEESVSPVTDDNQQRSHASQGVEVHRRTAGEERRGERRSYILRRSSCSDVQAERRQRGKWSCPRRPDRPRIDNCSKFTG